MATGGTPLDDGAEELQNWTVSNSSLEDRLNNMVRAAQNRISTHGVLQHFLPVLNNLYKFVLCPFLSLHPQGPLIL